MNYERDHSHTHCWLQDQPPACGQKLEDHKQCCLCSKIYKAKIPIKCECEKEPKKCEGCEPKAFGEVKPHRWYVCHTPLKEEVEWEELRKEWMKNQDVTGDVYDVNSIKNHIADWWLERISKLIKQAEERAVQEYIKRGFTEEEITHSIRKHERSLLIEKIEGIRKKEMNLEYDTSDPIQMRNRGMEYGYNSALETLLNYLKGLTPPREE